MDDYSVNPSITVIFMGDSITEGQYVTPDLRWSDLVASRVREAFGENEGDLHFFHNRGISGETTRDALGRYSHDVQSMRADVMTLQFGLNDCNCWDTDRGLPRVSELAYRANLIEMISRARHFGVKEIIVSTNHCTLRHKKMANDKTLEEGRVHYNEIVREVAAQTGVTLCDIEKSFNHFSRDQLAQLLLPEPDVLHLSPEGHTYYANVIYPYVLKAIQSRINHTYTMRDSSNESIARKNEH